MFTQKAEVSVKIGLRIDVNSTEPEKIHCQGAIVVLRR